MNNITSDKKAVIEMNITSNSDNKNNTTSLNGIPVEKLDKFSSSQINELLAGHNKMKSKDKDCGTIGNFIGASPKNAAINIACIVCIGFMLCCLLDVGLVLFEKKESINSEMWKFISPIITMIMGYMFGRGK